MCALSIYTSDTLEMELQVIVSYHVGADNETRVSLGHLSMHISMLLPCTSFWQDAPEDQVAPY